MTNSDLLTRRRIAAQFALASVALEGFQATDAVKVQLQRFIHHEIGFAALKAACDDTAGGERERDEANFATLRIFELELDPVAGVFDAAHLCEINRRIFQDLPAAGYADVTPGVYRPSVPARQDWVKTRSLSSVSGAFTVAYSRMDNMALEWLDQALKRCDPAQLKALDLAAFVDALAELYAQLDYVHPFVDGNSRTLRTFTRQLARTAGYNIDWSGLGSGGAARDALYVARDCQVNQLAQAHIVDFAARRETLFSMDVLGGNASLRDLLARVISAI